jgi:hypothetical protein
VLDKAVSSAWAPATATRVVLKADGLSPPLDLHLTISDVPLESAARNAKDSLTEMMQASRCVNVDHPVERAELFENSVFGYGEDCGYVRDCHVLGSG